MLNVSSLPLFAHRESSAWLIIKERASRVPSPPTCCRHLRAPGSFPCASTTFPDLDLRCACHLPYVDSSGTYVEGLTSIAVSSWDEMSQLLTYGGSERTVAATNANDWSSRSHAVFTLTLRQVRNKLGGACASSGVLRRLSVAFEQLRLGF